MERALVELARDGDEEAFASLIRMAGDRLMAVAFRILRDVDRAEDAVQQAIVTAWRELPTLRDLDRFGGWLYRILVNACYAEARDQAPLGRQRADPQPRHERRRVRRVRVGRGSR